MLVKKSNTSLLSKFVIPEPTRSLFFITNEDPGMIEDAGTINISVSARGVEKKENGFFSEPSLIWTKLPIEINDEITKEKMYYPSYARLSPRERYQYMSWLRNIEGDTNLSYVFLYYYGLERHLRIGNYDLAVDEVIRLVNHHDEGTFKSYASVSLLASSYIRDRVDILERAPFILDEVNNPVLCIMYKAQESPNAQQLIKLSGAVGFKNKSYIKKFPELFGELLQKNINKFEKVNGNIIKLVDINSLKKEKEFYFANLSIPDRYRYAEVHQIIKNDGFRKAIFDLLQDTHNEIKSKKIKQNRF